MKKKMAFTLAEVLVTLAIIGVVSALTIPTVVKNYREKETVSKLKKTYSALSQVTNKIISEEGPSKNWVASIDDVYNLYKKHLKTFKECGKTSGCLYSGAYNYMNGKTINLDNGSKYPRMVLSDGVQIMFWANNSSCSVNENGSTNICLLILADINGSKNPNTYGRDVFIFALKNNGLYPAGCDNGTDELAGCGKGYYGRSCACKVIREGAMNY